MRGSIRRPPRGRVISAAIAAVGTAAVPAAADHSNVIVLTGYWPPTNEMVRPFSDDPVLNPDGWIGGNWENRGFDVYSFFPTFSDPDCTSCGQGTGDLEVDYQDTSTDFWPIMNALQPVAIVTCSRTNANFSWELEMNAYNSDSWVNDYTPPYQPTPSPPDASVPADYLRTSTLPMQEIVDAVNDSGLGLDSFICFSQSAGNFLSGYIAYHGMWYQSLHADENDHAQCVMAGHVHVGDMVSWDTAHEATKISLRIVISSVIDAVGAGPADIDHDGVVGILDFLALLAAWGPCPAPPDACPADIDGDGSVGVLDFLALLAAWT
jgi:pyrrolidone-carboxylate peptidase